MNASAGLAQTVKPRSLGELPGPRGWPLLGNLLQIELDRLHQQIEAWAGEYGPLFRLRFGPRDALVVARPDLIASILRDRPDGWSRFSVMQAVFHEIDIDGVFASEGEAWRRQRRIVAAAFTPPTIGRYFPSHRAHHRAAEWASRGDAPATAKRIDLQTILMRYSVDVTASLAFGSDVDTCMGARTPSSSTWTRCSRC